jgi:hypothetical protein
VERVVCEYVTLCHCRDSLQENFRVYQNCITENLRKIFIQVTSLVVEAGETSSPRSTGGDGSVRYSK